MPKVEGNRCQYSFYGFLLSLGDLGTVIKQQCLTKASGMIELLEQQLFQESGPQVKT